MKQTPKTSQVIGTKTQEYLLFLELLAYAAKAEEFTFLWERKFFENGNMHSLQYGAYEVITKSIPLKTLEDFIKTFKEKGKNQPLKKIRILVRTCKRLKTKLFRLMRNHGYPYASPTREDYYTTINRAYDDARALREHITSLLMGNCLF